MKLMLPFFRLLMPLYRIWSKLSLSLSVLIGVLVGWMVYALLVAQAYGDLEDEISTAPVLQNLFKEDPVMLGLLETFETSTSQSTYSDMIKDAKIDIVSWRLLMAMGVLEADKSISDIGCLVNSSVIKPLLKSERGAIVKKPGVQIFIEMMKNLGNDDHDENIGELDDLIVKVLAHSPEAYEGYVDAVNKGRTSMGALESKGFVGEIVAFAFPSEVRGLWGEKASVNQTIGVVMKHLSASDLFDRANPLKSGDSCQMQPIEEEERQVEEFARRVLLEIHNSPGVAGKRDWVLFYQGPMQLLMFMTFFTCLSLLLTKFSNRLLKNEGELTDDEKFAQKQRMESRKWALGVLPFFGFIGTILGLMQALGDAYKIPLAQGGSNTAIAISEITGQLGIAFTTTLMAFSMVILLGFFELLADLYNVTKIKKELLTDGYGK